MLTEYLLSYIFSFCLSMKDACNFLMANNQKPNGIYCFLLRREFVKALRQPFSYYKFRRYVYVPSGKQSVLDYYKIVDNRYTRSTPVVFRSTVLELIEVKLRREKKWQCYYELRDHTNFFHLRMNGFIYHFCQENNFNKEQFQEYFQKDKLFIKTSNNRPMHAANQTFKQYVELTFVIYFDLIEKLFFPFALSFQFYFQ